MKKKFPAENTTNEIEVAELGDEIRVIHSMGVGHRDGYFSYNSHTYSIEAAEWLYEALGVCLTEVSKAREEEREYGLDERDK